MGVKKAPPRGTGSASLDPWKKATPELPPCQEIEWKLPGGDEVVRSRSTPSVRFRFGARESSGGAARSGHRTGAEAEQRLPAARGAIRSEAPLRSIRARRGIPLSGAGQGTSRTPQRRTAPHRAPPRAPRHLHGPARAAWRIRASGPGSPGYMPRILDLTWGFPSSGFQSGSCLPPRSESHRRQEAIQAAIPRQPLTGEAHAAARLHLVLSVCR